MHDKLTDMKCKHQITKIWHDRDMRNALVSSFLTSAARPSVRTFWISSCAAGIQSSAIYSGSPKTRQLIKLCGAMSVCYSALLLIDAGDVAQAFLEADGLATFVGAYNMPLRESMETM